MIDLPAISESAMLNDLFMINAIAHNVANVNTPGFRKDLTFSHSTNLVLQSLAETGVIAPSGIDQRAAIPITQVAVNFDEGAAKATANPLDLAINGTGLFEILTSEGPRYTRRGDFSVDQFGFIVDHFGDRLQGLDGDIRLFEQEPRIDEFGQIWEGREVIAQLKVAAAPEPAVLARDERGYFKLIEDGKLAAVGSPSVRQGHIESSNVDPASETVKLMEIRRHFEATQLVVRAYDEMVTTAITEIGEF